MIHIHMPVFLYSLWFLYICSIVPQAIMIHGWIVSDPTLLFFCRRLFDSGILRSVNVVDSRSFYFQLKLVQLIYLVLEELRIVPISCAMHPIRVTSMGLKLNTTNSVDLSSIRSVALMNSSWTGDERILLISSH
jgi:hypothetical protein